jgi:hypothetical protein
MRALRVDARKAKPLPNQKHAVNSRMFFSTARQAQSRNHTGKTGISLYNTLG